MYLRSLDRQTEMLSSSDTYGRVMLNSGGNTIERERDSEW